MSKKADEALSLLSGLVLEDGRRWGDAAERWQRDDAAAVLDVEGARYHFQTRPRGGAKTGDLAGVAVAALLVQAPRRARAYAFAADRDQSALLLDSVAGFVDRTPGLSGALRIDNYRVAVERSGASLAIEASDDASAWGLRPWLTIVDEVAQWKSTAGPRRLWAAVFSALPKVAGSRLVALTSAGDPAHWSYKILQQAKTSARWRVSEVPGPVPWHDPDDLVEQRATLPPWEYARLHLNVWTESEDRLTTVDDLRACVTLDGPREPEPGRMYAIGLDLGLKNDRTVAAVCSREADDPASPLVLDRMSVWTPTRDEPTQLSEVEAWLLHAWRTFGRPPLVADPWQTAQLGQRLRARGVEVAEYSFTQQSASRLALLLHQLIGDHALALPPDEELLDELANVRLRETSPGVYKLDHDPSRHDDRATALGLAAWALDDVTPPRMVDVEDVLGFDPTVRISDF